MKQLPLLALFILVVAAAAAPAAEGPAEFPVPCTDDGLAHIPEVPEGARRPYSVRKRSRTVHRDQATVKDDTPQLPPGQRRFDAILPDEQGHDITSSSPARGRSQRRLVQDEVNEVGGEQQVRGQQRTSRRLAARPKKIVEENYPIDHPAFAKHDAKSDAVVDSYEKVRKYPTHLPAEDGDDDDDNLASNDVHDAPVVPDQVAIASTEQVDDDNNVSAVDGNSDLPPGYRSKFPKRTFASDVGGSGDVLRIKPRKHANQFEPQHHEENEQDHEVPAAPHRRPRPRPQSQPLQPEEGHEEVAVDAVDSTTSTPTGAGAVSRGRQRYRASQRVRAGGAGGPQRRKPIRRRPEAASESLSAPEAVADDVSEAPQPERQVRRRPQSRPRPTPSVDENPVEVVRQDSVAQPEQRPALRRRPRPRPVTTPEPTAVDQTDASAVTVSENLNLIQENAVSLSPQPSVNEASDGRPQQRPLRRRPRPGPTTAVENQENAVQRRRRPTQGAGSRTLSEESFQVEGSPQPSSRGHGRRLVAAPPAQKLPEVEVNHDGTAVDKKNHEPTLVRSAVKKVPAGGQAGDPSPALIQKIVKNTLRRLKPQIAEHEGDVGVDILVKIIQVEDR